MMVVACGGDDTTTTAGMSGSSSGSTGTGTTGTASTSTGDLPTTDAPTGGSATGTGTTSDSTGLPETTGSTGSTGSVITTGTTGSTGATTIVPAVCGDGVLDDGELCDGAELGGQTCASLGFDAGELACSDTCEHDTSACFSCGDGVKNGDEECDDGNQDPGDGCDADCQVEACDPDGVYMVQGPAIAYSCCQGLVSVSVNSFTLATDGSLITSSPSNPVAMTGAATTCPDGDFMNSGMIPGGCTEVYKVSGSFVDPNTWMGTYSLEFIGQQCTCFDGMLGTPCINQQFQVTAKR